MTTSVIAPISNPKKLKLYRALVARDGEICQWCGRAPTEVEPLTIDHIDPRGGDGLANLQLLCLRCNSQKGDSVDDKTVRWVSSLWQRGFTMKPNAVIDSDAMSVYAHRLYDLFLYYARQDDACWPGQEGLRRLMKCSERQTRHALRELEAAGLVRTRRRGQGKTNVYILLVPRTARGADPDSRPAEYAGQDQRNMPIEEEAGNKSSAPPPRWNGPQSVGGKRVTRDEVVTATAVLDHFNLVSGRRFAGKEWLTKIVRRLREHPDVALERHREIISEQFERPWWKGDASPSVIYGNGAVFDRAVNAVRGKKPRERIYTRA